MGYHYNNLIEIKYLSCCQPICIECNPFIFNPQTHNSHTIKVPSCATKVNQPNQKVESTFNKCHDMLFLFLLPGHHPFQCPHVFLNVRISFPIGNGF